MPAASGSMVKTGTASVFQAASGVTRLRILSGLFFSRLPDAIASMTAMLPEMRRCIANWPRRKWSSSRKSRPTRALIRSREFRTLKALPIHLDVGAVCEHRSNLDPYDNAAQLSPTTYLVAYCQLLYPNQIRLLETIQKLSRPTRPASRPDPLALHQSSFSVPFRPSPQADQTTGLRQIHRKRDPAATCQLRICKIVLDVPRTTLYTTHLFHRDIS